MVTGRSSKQVNFTSRFAACFLFWYNTLMEKSKAVWLNKLINWIFIISFASVIGASFYHFLYKKNYDYLVETSCDPAIEECYYRDCENPDDCPPNQLSVYKVYYVKSYDFATCTDNSCKDECESGAIRCEPIPCDIENEDICEPIEEESIE